MLHKSLIAIAMVAAPIGAAAQAAPDYATAPLYGDKTRDRASILAMAGTYKVTFDMRETASFVPGYTLLKPKLSGGHEVVRVVVDTPDTIGLQHMLVVETEAKKPMVIKHWRQDWTWQPKQLLVYAGRDRWTLRAVPVAEAKGAWSQTVYQTDDSPRYGGVGRWRYDGGVARWTSDETVRPLARRDATLKPAAPYDHYVGTNRHALTAAGWVHEQDNAKVGVKDGHEQTFAHEILINSYVASTDYDPAPADEYWAKTSDYWALVRSEWDRAIAARHGLALGEDAENGSVTGHELMLIADDLVTGEAKLDDAKKEAADLIRKETAAR